MKHIFVINPTAGKSDCSKVLIPEIERIFAGRENEYEIHLTTGVGDATAFTRACCAASGEEHLRFYSCGGDGTMNEVLQGMAECRHAALGVVPCGSGNDFVRSFPGCDFTDLALQVAAEEKPIDLIRFNDIYSANICSAGLDSDVCKNMIKYKNLPLVSGSGAYILALVSVFFSPLGKHAVITLDDGRMIEQDVLIMVMGNGGFYGGGWNGAPNYNVEDGLMDLCIVKKVSRLRILQIIGTYKKGRHADNPKMADCITYTRCRGLHIDFDAPTTLNADGEVTESTTVDAEILPLALRLVLPEKS